MVLYGPCPKLLKYKDVDFDENIDDKWNTNCFGVDVYAYAVDTPSKEQLEQLINTFPITGGMNQHQFYIDQIVGEVTGWAKDILFRDGVLFKSLGLLPNESNFMDIVRENIREQMSFLGIQAAARAVPRYKENTAVLYLINADEISPDNFPELNMWEIGESLLSDWKQNKDKRSGQDTVGGDGTKPSPLNASKIIYMDAGRDIMVGHWHTLQQYFNIHSLIFSLRQLSFVTGQYAPTYPDIHQIIADYLGLEVREIK